LFQIEYNWKHYLVHKPKIRQYVHFKSNYEMESYKNIATNKFNPSLIANLGCGILQMTVKLGRFNPIRLEDNLYEICKECFIEDEIPVVCIC